MHRGGGLGVRHRRRREREVGLIVGYVSGSHVAKDLESAQARSLLEGKKSDDGRGADVVIRDMEDLPVIVNYFLDLKMDDPEKCKRGGFDFSKIESQLGDRCWYEGRLPGDSDDDGETPAGNNPG